MRKSNQVKIGFGRVWLVSWTLVCFEVTEVRKFSQMVRIANISRPVSCSFGGRGVQTSRNTFFPVWSIWLSIHLRCWKALSAQSHWTSKTLEESKVAVKDLCWYDSIFNIRYIYYVCVWVCKCIYKCVQRTHILYNYIYICIVSIYLIICLSLCLSVCLSYLFFKSHLFSSGSTLLSSIYLIYLSIWICIGYRGHKSSPSFLMSSDPHRHVKTSSRWLKPTRVMPQRTYRKCQELEQCWFIRPAWRSNTHQFRLHHVPNRLFLDDEGIDRSWCATERKLGMFWDLSPGIGHGHCPFSSPKLRSRWDVQGCSAVHDHRHAAKMGWPAVVFLLWHICLPGGG